VYLQRFGAQRDDGEVLWRVTGEERVDVICTEAIDNGG
jgi:hypothetical protein